jgi:putative protein kinase ArgK-like GTPase of G3E family
MSEELQNQVDTLTTENTNLKTQIAQTNEGVKNLLAQLDAHKQYLNESIISNLSLRTNLFLGQKVNEELNAKISGLENPV